MAYSLRQRKRPGQDRTSTTKTSSTLNGVDSGDSDSDETRNLLCKSAKETADHQAHVAGITNDLGIWEKQGHYSSGGSDSELSDEKHGIATRRDINGFDNLKSNDLKDGRELKSLEKRLRQIKGLVRDRSLLLFYVIVPLFLTGAAVFTRVWRTSRAPYVVWDEAHFGKFASYYLKREFYFDVHPPLGKMLNGFAGWIAGYDGSFEFESGKDYPETLNYTRMRVFNGLFGAMCVPLAYFTCLNLNMSVPAALIAGAFVLFDNSFATISRFILLDSMLLFFTASALFAFSRFVRYRNAPLSRSWFKWMIITGVNLGYVCSVKWVGMFCTALIGLYTIEELWTMLGDRTLSLRQYSKHWSSRIIALIVVPFMVYTAMFALHFSILSKSGTGDAQMPSLFQANLEGSDLKNSPLNVAFGSQVTIKNAGLGGGLLHSHIQTYPEGSGQQQVTCYHHKDANNNWLIHPPWTKPDLDPESPNLEYIEDRSIIRLVHQETKRNLHTHEVPAPLTKLHREVSCYGNATVGDYKDHWVIEVVEDLHSKDRHNIRTLLTTFRLKSATLGCYLRACNVNLPKWGFTQIEVTCDPDSSPSDSCTHWNIEQHENQHMVANMDESAYKSSFWRNFVHLNVGMMTSNNALIPDPDKYDNLASTPTEWPLCGTALRMNGWDDARTKFMMVGNPIVYFSTAAALLSVAVLSVYYILRRQRQIKDLSDAEFDYFHFVGQYTFGAWFLHYFPFFIMGRVLYIHHYEPALYCGILCLAFMYHFLTMRLRPRFQWLGALILCVSAFAMFVFLAPVTFGMDGPAENFRRLKLRKVWPVY